MAVLWTAVLLACALCCAAASAVGAAHRGAGPPCIALGMAGAAAWSAAVAALSTSPGPTAVVVLRLLTTSGALAVAGCAYWLSRVVRDPHRRPSAVDAAVLAGIPAVVLGALVANPWHQLLYVDEVSGDPPALRWGEGPLYPQLIAVIGVPGALALVHLGRGLAASPSPYRPHALRLLLAGLAITACILASVAASGPWHHVDVVPLGLAVAAVVFADGLLRRRLLAVLPLARAQVVEELPDAVLVTDAHGLVVDVNASCRALLARLPGPRGGGAGEVLGLPLHDALPFLAPVGAGPGGTSPLPGLHLDVRTSAIRSSRGALVGRTVLLRDVSEVVERRMAAERTSERLADEAARDPLTGLLNRRGLHAAAAALPPADRLAVVIVDVDHFKAVNDTHGHDAGDAVLRSLSSTLLDAVVRRAATGAVAARLGGEEFALLLPGLDPEGGAAVAEEVLAGLRTTTTPVVALTGTAQVRATASAGVAGGTGMTAAQLVREADAALYTAKQRGRDRVVVAETADPERAA